MEVWYHCKPDGVLHYIIDVQGTPVRRHVDQIRPVGDKVQGNIILLPMHQRFHISSSEGTALIFGTQKRAEAMSSKELEQGIGFIFRTGVPSADVCGSRSILQSSS
ncbi:hypothetical protein TNCV_246751 [Trichonephila clavipes]|nr:hypothetical protein TNCV_246751 [Trichonephila clavipes]